MKVCLVSSEKSALVFGVNTVVVFRQREDFKRDQMLASSRRRKRATSQNSVSIRFRLTQENGLLYYSRSGADDVILQVTAGEMEYVSRTAGILYRLKVADGIKVTDAKWHNITLIVNGKR